MCAAYRHVHVRNDRKDYFGGSYSRHSLRVGTALVRASAGAVTKFQSLRHNAAATVCVRPVQTPEWLEPGNHLAPTITYVRGLRDSTYATVSAVLVVLLVDIDVHCKVIALFHLCRHSVRTERKSNLEV